MNSGEPRLCQHVLLTAATDLYIVLGTTSLKMFKIRDQDFMLITRVNKSLHWVSIDLAVDVEHNHLSEAFRGLLHRNSHIFLHVMLPEIFKKGIEIYVCVCVCLSLYIYIHTQICMICIC